MTAVPRGHTARYTLAVHPRIRDDEIIFILSLTCDNTQRVCRCRDLDEKRLAERLDATCGHPHRLIINEGLVSRLPGHRKYIERVRRRDENTWLKAEREDRQQHGRASPDTERKCKAIRERRAAAKKAAAAERKRARAKAKEG